MNKFFALTTLALCLLLPAAYADGPEDQYVTIYTLIQQGDTLSDKGQTASARAKYIEAQTALKQFQNGNPNWNNKVVNFRLKYLAGKIEELAPQNAGLPAPNDGAVNGRMLTNIVVPVAPLTLPVSTSTDTEVQIKNLQQQVSRSEAEKALLEAKLKEALAAQPAATDPRELAKAQDQIQSLQKENELLKTSLAQSKTNLATAAGAEKARQDLAEVNRKLAAVVEANAILMQEKAALQNQVQNFAAGDSTTTALREENAILKKQMADLQVGALVPAANGDVTAKLQAAQAQLAALQSDKAILQLERTALENRLAQPATNTINVTNVVVVTNMMAGTVMMDSVTAGKLSQLEHQRDELQKSLEAANRQLYGKKKGRDATQRIDELTRQLASLRARIDILEAREVPYNSDELALLTAPDVSLKATARSGKKSPRTLPASAGPLLAQAKNFFSAHEYEKAEAKYLEILKLDEKNPTTLTDLASIQLQLNRPEAAENYLNTALAVDPNDDYTLFVLGQLKFAQKNYDEALNALSRAAQMNPQNPQVQNFLGLTLSEKGLRGPAETAFRRAIQSDPGFADAHNNLAFVYATQQPPLLELARWHYQKALAAGHAPNPKLEKFLDPARETVPTANP